MSTPTLSIPAAIAAFSPVSKLRTLPQANEAFERVAEACRTSPNAAAAIAERDPGPKGFRTLGAARDALSDVFARLAALGHAPAASSLPTAPTITAPTLPPAATRAPSGPALLATLRSKVGTDRATFFKAHQAELAVAMQDENKISRAEFNAMSPTKRMSFCRSGGQLTD